MAQITVIIPTSPIPSHPSRSILETTIGSIRSHLPGVPIIVTCDGISPAYKGSLAYYTGYVDGLKNGSIPGITVMGHNRHVHQSGMMLAVLPLVKTPLLVYLEHDWELGVPIEWDELSSTILSGEVNYVKFYQGNRIHPLHEHMMFERVVMNDVPLIHTVQFSANPHLASTAWYRSLTHFFRGKTDYIENLLHGPIAVAPWEAYKLTIYNPVNGDMKRSFHLDGAGSR